MKKMTILTILIGFIACTERENTPSEQIAAYYEGFANADYNQVKRTLADSLNHH